MMIEITKFNSTNTFLYTDFHFLLDYKIHVKIGTINYKLAFTFNQDVKICE